MGIVWSQTWVVSVVVVWSCLGVGCERKVAMPTGTSPTQPQQAGAVKNRVDKEKAQQYMRQLYIAYMATQAMSPEGPRSEEDLKAQLEGGDKLLKSPRDGQKFIICYGVNLSNLPKGASETLLMWESTANSEGARCGVLADGRPVYLTEDEFRRFPKANDK